MCSYFFFPLKMWPLNYLPLNFNHKACQRGNLGWKMAWGPPVSLSLPFMASSLPCTSVAPVDTGTTPLLHRARTTSMSASPRNRPPPEPPSSWRREPCRRLAGIASQPRAKHCSTTIVGGGGQGEAGANRGWQGRWAGGAPSARGKAAHHGWSAALRPWVSGTVQHRCSAWMQAHASVQCDASFLLPSLSPLPVQMSWSSTSPSATQQRHASGTPAWWWLCERVAEDYWWRDVPVRLPGVSCGAVPTVVGCEATPTWWSSG